MHNYVNIDTGWPDGFSILDDTVFETRIMPFIDARMAALAALDHQRRDFIKTSLPPDYRMTYIFHEHALRVAGDMRQTALFLGLPAFVAETLYWAMLPHDIGKAALPAGLWDRVDKPDDAVKNLRRSHTERGVDMLDRDLAPDHPFTALMRDIMLNHHEQMDGRGYRGVSGGDLSAPVRLACIVESYDGYAIERPHFGGRDISPAGVLARMRDEKGAAHYDMNLFEAFAEMKVKQETQKG